MDEANEYHEEYRPLPWGAIKAELIRRWPLVGLLGLALAAIAAVVALLLPKYEASGFYYTPGWALADYKKFRSEYGSYDVLEVYLSGLTSQEPAGNRLLSARAKDPKFWETAVRPLFPITKKDAREIFESSKEQETTAIIGLDLAIDGRSPEAARDAVLALGGYVTQTLLLTSLQTWAVSGQAAATSELTKTENETLRMRYSMEQMEKRVVELRDLDKKYPSAMAIAARQVVTVDGQSSKFLPPLTQAVALESSLAEARESLRRMERRVRQLRIEVSFFDKAAVASKSAREGMKVLTAVEDVKRKQFEELDTTDDEVREVFNRLELDLKAFRDQYSIGFGFRSPVLVPTQSERSPVKLALVGGVLGLLLGLVVVLAPVVVVHLSPPARNGKSGLNS